MLGVRRGIEQRILGCPEGSVILGPEGAGIAAGRRSNGEYRVRERLLMGCSGGRQQTGPLSSKGCREMEVTKASLSDVEKLAGLDERPIEDERHPNPMNVEQLARRMRGTMATT